MTGSGKEVGRLSVRRAERGGAAFEVVDADGVRQGETTAFLEYLAACGSSFYTQRSYAFGVAHFLSWLAKQGRVLAEVDRQVVVRYIADFRTGERGGACAPDGGRAGQAGPLAGRPTPSREPQPRTVNHRLSVLASFFDFLVEYGVDGWAGDANPVPRLGTAGVSHGMPGRDAPRRGRPAELRRRPPRRVPRSLQPELAERLIGAASSWRDKAILTLLWRTGQRIGDWLGGGHGVLGMRLGDLDERSRTVVVRLKGARDQHRVPVADDFWPLFARYLAEERRSSSDAAWVALRRGRGRPLTYAAFESSLRYAARKVGARVTAHMFRHTLAQALVETSGLKVAQEVLGHAHVGTTADAYARVDIPAVVEGLAGARALLDTSRSDTSGGLEGEVFAFRYDAATLVELERLANPTRQEPGR
jgi:integrase/recombinase XerD